MTRVCVHIVRHALVMISLLVDAGLSFAAAQMKLDATIRLRSWAFPIGQMSWTVEIHDNRFESVAKGAISGFLRLFLDVQGEVTAHGALSGGKPVASNFSLKLLAGKWSDDVRIVFSGNKAKEYVAAAPANPSANHVPLTEADRIGAVDPMTALLVHIGGTEQQPYQKLVKELSRYLTDIHAITCGPPSSGSTPLRLIRAIKGQRWCVR